MPCALNLYKNTQALETFLPDACSAALSTAAGNLAGGSVLFVLCPFPKAKQQTTRAVLGSGKPPVEWLVTGACFVTAEIWGKLVAQVSRVNCL